MNSELATILGTLAGATIAASAAWLLVRANRDNIDAETDEIHDRITRDLRRDLHEAHGTIDTLLAANALCRHLIRVHWLDHHPDEDPPGVHNTDG